MDIDLADLPDDVETLQQMVRTLATERVNLTEAQAEIEPEPFNLRLRLSEVDAFGRKRSDHLLQRLYIIWQIGKIDVHEPEVYADSHASSPDPHAGEAIGRS